MRKDIYMKLENTYLKFHVEYGVPCCTIIHNYGCTYKEDVIKFKTREEGNACYKLIKDKWTRIDASEYEKVVRGY